MSERKRDRGGWGKREREREPSMYFRTKRIGRAKACAYGAVVGETGDARANGGGTRGILCTIISTRMAELKEPRLLGSD